MTQNPASAGTNRKRSSRGDAQTGPPRYRTHTAGKNSEFRRMKNSFVSDSRMFGGSILLLGRRQILPKHVDRAAGRSGDRLETLTQALAGEVQRAGRRFEPDVENERDFERRDKYPPLADRFRCGAPRQPGQS